MRAIPLFGHISKEFTKRVVFVDDGDYEWLMKYRWYLTSAKTSTRLYYATREIDSRYESMHKVIMGITPNGMVIDHIDRNGLNNQRSNLRFATLSENSRNTNRVDKARARRENSKTYLRELVDKFDNPYKGPTHDDRRRPEER